jgi:tetratricopeptide (TPR) repeat protein
MKQDDSYRNKEIVFTEAAQYHQLGNLQKAESLYRLLLVQNPLNHQAIHWLGIMVCQAYTPEQGIVLLLRSILIFSNNPYYYRNLSKAFTESNQFERAKLSNLKALILSPEITEFYDQYLELYISNGNFENIVTSANYSLKLDPLSIVTRQVLANYYYRVGLKKQSFNVWMIILSIDPQQQAIWCNIGVVLQESKSFDQARRSYRFANYLSPYFYDPYYNIGNLYQELKEINKAIHAWTITLIIYPSHQASLTNIGICLGEMGSNRQALSLLKRVLCLNPASHQAHSNLGVIYQNLKNWSEAIHAHRQSIALHYDNISAHFNLAHCLLTIGDYEKGWVEYEWRLKMRWKNVYHRDLNKPQWTGEEGRGRYLLIHADGGFYGDVIQFCRFIPMVLSKGWRVIIEVPAKLISLLSQIPNIECWIARGDPLPYFDYHSPLMSLPHALSITLQNLDDEPYLQANQIKIDKWKKRVTSLSIDKPKIGLVWAGHPYLHSAEKQDERRSISFALLKPLIDNRDYQFFSLQKEGETQAHSDILIDFMSEIEDFDDCAALVMNLDLVITVDTAMVHLAGSLGQKVWMLDRLDSCWRWLRDKETSPWYSSLRIFRQATLRDWSTVIDNVQRELKISFPKSTTKENQA